MPKLTVTITNQSGGTTGKYVIDYDDRHDLDGEAYHSARTIDLIRSVAERDDYLKDFPEPPVLSLMSPTSVPGDPLRTANIRNVNELWFEIQNLLYGARVNFSSSRMLKKLEDQYSLKSHMGVNATFDLHLDKMERFNLGVFELSRIEDLIVRIVYEYFGQDFIEFDPSTPDWERKLTWNRMKDALNKREKPQQNPHPRVITMPETEYQELMRWIRQYRSKEVLELVNYRDRRTHRVVPTVDHPELGVNVASTIGLASGQPPSDPASKAKAEFDFMNLYALSAEVYKQLLEILMGINSVIHA
jgi:hypothetical protein